MHGSIERVLAASFLSLDFVFNVGTEETKQFNFNTVFVNVVDVNALFLVGVGFVQKSIEFVLEVSTAFNNDGFSRKVVRNFWIALGNSNSNE